MDKNTVRVSKLHSKLFSRQVVNASGGSWAEGLLPAERVLCSFFESTLLADCHQSVSHLWLWFPMQLRLTLFFVLCTVAVVLTAVAATACIHRKQSTRQNE